MVKIPEPISAEQARFRRLKMKKLDWLHWLLLALICAAGLFLFLSPYHYEKMGRNAEIVRIHRVTGQADALTSDGWQPMLSLEAKYPTHADKIAIARKEGYSDWEIEKYIRSRIQSEETNRIKRLKSEQENQVKK